MKKPVSHFLYTEQKKERENTWRVSCGDSWEGYASVERARVRREREKKVSEPKAQDLTWAFF